jgi:hypothetical protein
MKEARPEMSVIICQLTRHQGKAILNLHELRLEDLQFWKRLKFLPEMQMCNTTLPHIELKDSFFSSSGKLHSLAQFSQLRRKMRPLTADNYQSKQLKAV